MHLCNNKTLYLGIDTSNYRTSAGIYDVQDGTWQQCGKLLDVPQGSIGLRQSDALFAHTQRLHAIIAQLPHDMAQRLAAVGVSTQPRAVEGSYMPCFLAGENVARSLAHVLGVPCYACSHQQGHLAAAALSANVLDWLNGDFLAWHLSGGTTELLLVQSGADGLPQAQCIGGTTDIAAGQLIDRAGNLLGLPFPAGVAMEQLCQQAEGEISKARLQVRRGFSPKVTDCKFSLSGMENKVQDLVARQENPADVAMFTLQTVGNAIEKASGQAKTQHALPILCAGGVMSNRNLQQRMAQKFGAKFAEPLLSGDNGVGVAVLASRLHAAVITEE